MVEPHSSNFRVITTNGLGVRIFRKFTVMLCLSIPTPGFPKFYSMLGADLGQLSTTCIGIGAVT